MLFNEKLSKVWPKFIFAINEAESHFLHSITKDTFKNVILLYNHRFAVGVHAKM